MKKSYLPWLLLFCAIGLSATAAYYSVIGLSIVFSSVAIPVIVMGSFLEISKLSIATYLHNSWSKIYTMLKIYLTTALIVLSFITSIGIYGLLSGGFQQNISQLEVGSRIIKNVSLKKQNYETIKKEHIQEKTSLDKDISTLRNALANNTTILHVDKNTGIVTRDESVGNRRSYEKQLAQTFKLRDKLNSKIDILNDSINTLDVKLLDLENHENVSSELGVIKYIHEITGWEIKKVANSFILLLIFVFDPLAIMLVIATNHAFESNKPKINIYGEIKHPEENIPHQEFPSPFVETPRDNTLSQVKKMLFDEEDTSKTY